VDLLEKLGNIEIKVIDRFHTEDMEYCRQVERDYQEAYNIYSEYSYIAKEANEQIKGFSDKLYIQLIDDNKDKVYDCNERFISQGKSIYFLAQNHRKVIFANFWSNNKG